MCNQMAGAPASVPWPRAPPGLGPPGTFHVAALGTAPQDCPAWRHRPLGTAAHGWGTAPTPAPAWGGRAAAGARRAEQLLAGSLPMRAQPSLALAAVAGPEEAGPPAKSRREESPRAEPPREAAGAQDGAGATSWTHAWEVDSRILKSCGSRVASPEFELRLLGQEPTKFVLMLNTHKESLGTVGRGGNSFKRAKGCGKVSIKCKGGPLETTAFSIDLWLKGDGQACQPRDTVQWSFAERSMYEHGWWKLKAVPDQAKLRVGVQFTVAAPAPAGLGAAPGGLDEAARGDDAAGPAADCLVDPGPPPSL